MCFSGIYTLRYLHHPFYLSFVKRLHSWVGVFCKLSLQCVVVLCVALACFKRLFETVGVINLLERSFGHIG